MSRYPHDKISQDEVKLEDQTAKAVCGFVNVPPYIETLPCGLLNVMEATEAQGQHVAQVEMREIRMNQREDEHLETQTVCFYLHPETSMINLATMCTYRVQLFQNWNHFNYSQCIRELKV